MCRLLIAISLISEEKKKKNKIFKKIIISFNFEKLIKIQLKLNKNLIFIFKCQLKKKKLLKKKEKILN